MSGAVFPPCLLFGMRQASTGAYRLMVWLMAASGRAQANEYFPEFLLPVTSSTQWSTATCHLCRRPSNASRQVWPILLWGHCFFPMHPGAHKTLCVPSGVKFLFPPVLWKSCNQIPLAFKARLSGDSSSHFWTPSLGILMWGSELSLQLENFWGTIVLQSVVHPPSRYETWFYHKCTLHAISPWLLLCP